MRNSLLHDFSPRAIMQWIGGSLIGLLLTVAYMSWLNHRPAVRILNDGAQSVAVDGTDVYVTFDSTRVAPPCPGSKLDREFVRYLDNDHHEKQFEFVEEHDQASIDPGTYRIHLHLTLRHPLTKELGWLYKSQVDDNCGVLSWLFPAPPSRSLELPVRFVSHPS